MLNSLLIAIALTASGTGQDPVASVPGAFSALTSGESVILTGSVKKESAPQAGGRRVMVMGAAGGPERFEGAFEAAVDPSGRLLVTTDSFPGFGIYSGERGKLVQTYYEAEPLDVTRLERELAGLLDFPGLAKHAANVEWKVEPDAGGTTRLTGELPAKLVPAAPPGPRGLGLIAPKVLRVDAELTLEKGMLRTARYSIVYSDPMAKMAGGPGARKLRLSSDGTVETLPGDPGETPPVEGDVVEYRMMFQRGKLTKALRSWEQVSAILLQARDAR